MVGEEQEAFAVEIEAPRGVNPGHVNIVRQGGAVAAGTELAQHVEGLVEEEETGPVHRRMMPPPLRNCHACGKVCALVNSIQARKGTPVLRTLAALTLLALSSAPATAAVRFADWTPDTIDAVIAAAATRDSYVMVVITQPDWCPGCIQLDHELLRNPAAESIAALTADWQVLEVLGYDEPDASFLAEQGLGFLGTPTTLLLRPQQGDRRLGDARQVAAIVGYPDDYEARLREAAAGHDAIVAAQTAVRERNDVQALEALAQAYLAAGQAESARRVFRSLLLREELTPEQQRDISLRAILQPTQRVENDHVRTLEELEAWAGRYPEGRSRQDFTYARALALLATGQLEAATAYIDEVYARSDDPETVAQYLYLAFREPTRTLLPAAEVRARAAITDFPQQAARFHSAHGRLLRRMGRLEEAEQAFAAAVDKAAPDHPSLGTYQGQLEFVRRELASRGG